MHKQCSNSVIHQFVSVGELAMSMEVQGLHSDAWKQKLSIETFIDTSKEKIVVLFNA